MWWNREFSGEENPESLDKIPDVKQPKKSKWYKCTEISSTPMSPSLPSINRNKRSIPTN